MIDFLQPWIRLKNKIGSGVDLYDDADEVVQLWPSEERFSPQAFYDTNDLKRVRAAGWGTTLEYELLRISSGIKKHAATNLYRFKNAVMTNGHIRTKRGFHRVGLSPPRLVNKIPTARITKASLGVTNLGLRFFGNWLLDDLPMMLAASESASLISPQVNLSPHQVDYLDALKIPIKVCQSAVIDDLYIIDDRGFNSFRRERVIAIRERLQEGLSSSECSGVFFSRGTSGIRRFLVNEYELRRSLVRRGIICIDPTSMPMREILSLSAGAKVIIGVEGSHLSHAIWCMTKESSMVVIQPPNRFDNNYKDRCDLLGNKYGFIVGEVAGKASDFSVDVGRLNILLDAVLMG